MKSAEEVGKRLIAFRVSKGFTKQSHFLRALQEKIKDDITQGNLSHWENGRFVPEYESLLPIKEVFPDFDIRFILTGTKEPSPEDLRQIVDKFHPRNNMPKEAIPIEVLLEQSEVEKAFWKQKYLDELKKNGSE